MSSVNIGLNGIPTVNINELAVESIDVDELRVTNNFTVTDNLVTSTGGLIGGSGYECFKFLRKAGNDSVMMAVGVENIFTTGLLDQNVAFSAFIFGNNNSILSTVDQAYEGSGVFMMGSNNTISGNVNNFTGIVFASQLAITNTNYDPGTVLFLGSTTIPYSVRTKSTQNNSIKATLTISIDNTTGGPSRTPPKYYIALGN